MAMACGRAIQEIVILDSGLRTKLTVTVYMSGKTAIATRANGGIVSGMGRVLTSSLTVMFILANTAMVELRVMGSTDGLMVIHIVVCLRKE
jgi:hypothetical protein